MAETRQEARLNLVLSATDDASKVVENFVVKAKEQFESLKNIIAETFNPSQIAEPIKESAQAFDPFERAMKKANDTLFYTKDQLVTAFKEIQESAKESNLAMVDSSQLSLSQMKKWVQEFHGKKVELIQDMGDIKKSWRDTLEEMNQKFNFIGLQIAGQMLEDLGRKGVEFFGSAVKSAGEFDQEIWNTISSLKALDPKLNNEQAIYERLTQKALEFGSQGYFSANQVAQAMNTLAKQAVGGQEEIINAAKTVTQVAAANQQDLEETANVVSDIWHEFGDELKQELGPGSTTDQIFQHIGNIMTSTLHHARLSMTEYLDTLKYVGPLASKAGWDLKQTSLAIALLAQHGIRGSQAGTTLRRMLTNLIPETSKAKEEMKNLGFITKDGANVFVDASGKIKPFDQVMMILHDRLSKLPPAMQEMALKTIFGQYSLAGMATIAGTSKDKLEALANGFGRASATTDALNEKNHGLGYSLQKLNAAFDTFKKVIGEQLAGPVKKIAEWLEHLMQKFEKLDPSTKKFIVIGGAIASVLAVVVGGLIAAAGAIGLFIMGISTAGPLLAGIAAPILGVVAAIAAIIAIVIACKKAWDSNWHGIRTGTQQFLNYMSQLPSKISKWFNQMVDDVVKWFKQLGKDVQKIWVDFQKWISNATQEVVQFIVKAFEWLYNHNYYFQNLVDKIVMVWKWLTQVSTEIWNSITSFLSNTWNSISSRASAIWNALVAYLTYIFNQIWSTVSSVWNNVSSKISSVWNSIKGYVHDGVTFIWDKLSNLANQALSWGSNLMDMLARGIESGINKVVSAAKGVAIQIAKFLGFHSPTEEGPASDSDTWMPNMMRMFAEGIKQHRPNIQQELFKIALDMQYTLNPSINKHLAIEHARKRNEALHWVNLISHITPTPQTPSFYERRMGHVHHSPTVIIQIDGRSKETDKQLLDALQERLARHFRTHLSMQTSL